MEIILLLAFYLICVFVWSMNIWGGWAEKTYDKYKDKKYYWFWLRLFKIEETNENCIKFLKFTSILGIILMSLMIVIPLLIKFI